MTLPEADMRIMTEPGAGDHLHSDDPAPHQPVIAAFGNPLLDIIVSDEAGEMVQRLGLEADIAQEVDTLELGLLDMVREKEDIQYSGGGCALNTARVYQWLSGDLGLCVVSRMLRGQNKIVQLCLCIVQCYFTRLIQKSDEIDLSWFILNMMKLFSIIKLEEGPTI